MTFILEAPTDDQRAEQGFATEKEWKSYVGLGMKIVDVWAIDRERKTIMLGTRTVLTHWEMELHWKQHVILIHAVIDEKYRNPKEGETGTHKIDMLFNVNRLAIPKTLKNQTETIKELIREGLAVYCAGMKKYNGTGFTAFLPDMPVYYTDQNPKSAVKLADFKTNH